MVNVKINIKARQHVRELLKEYNQLKQEQKFLREAIMNPYHEGSDENVGGGRSTRTSFDVEDKAIKLASHAQLKFRAQAVYTIDSVLAKSSDEAQRIIELKYFAKEPCSWVKIAENVEGYSEDSCRKIERKVVDVIAQTLGW